MLSKKKFLMTWIILVVLSFQESRTVLLRLLNVLFVEMCILSTGHNE